MNILLRFLLIICYLWRPAVSFWRPAVSFKSPSYRHDSRTFIMSLTSTAGDDLLLRQANTLTSSGAQLAMDAAEKEARSHGWLVSIAIADNGGTPLLVKRMDGAFAASYQIAVEKARTAAMFEKPTGSLESAVNVKEGESRSALLSAPFVLMRGGLPIEVKGSTLGSIGVSGVAPDQDEAIASAGVTAISRFLSSKL